MKRIIQLLLLLLPIWVSAQTAPETEVVCGETYVVTPKADAGYHFVRWSDDYPNEVRTFTAEEDISFTAIFAADDAPIIITDDQNLSDLKDYDGDGNIEIIVQPGGELKIDNTAHTIKTIIIEADGTNSGQIHNAGSLAASENIDIIMDYRLDPVHDVASPDQWYAFAVPFEVNIHEGITRKEGSPSHVYSTDFLIMEYDGEQRAATGKGWKELQGDRVYPGNFYLIGIEGTCNHWLFKKANGTALPTATSIDVAENPSPNPQNAGINGIANPSLEYMQASGSSTYICLFNNVTGKFEDPVLMSDATFAVGQPFFIQTDANGQIDFDLPTAATSNPVIRRVAGRHNSYIKLTLARENERTQGRMYISLHDDGIYDRYIIGRDFARMDNSNVTPHMWCEAYGLSLAAHGIPTPDTETVIPFNLSVPANGTYRLQMNAVEMDEYVVELLYLGEYVANLTYDEPQSLELNKGTMSDYSLRIRRKMPTDISNTQTDNELSTKVLMDQQLYIRHGEHIYDALGRKIK